MNTLTKTFSYDLFPLQVWDNVKLVNLTQNVDFPVLSAEQLPNGTQGEPYSATATFNLPPSVV